LSYDINFKELFAVVAAIFTWGHLLQNKQIIIYSDNLTIVNVWKKGSCKQKLIMSLVRKLFLFIAHHNINIIVEHFPGEKNLIADALSRLQVSKFRNICPEAEQHPSNIHSDIWQF